MTKKQTALKRALEMGIECDDSWTEERLTAEIARTEQITSADGIYRELKSNQTKISKCKLMFVAPSKYGIRLIVERKDNNTQTVKKFGVYAYPEVIEYSGAKVGDIISILAEQRDGKDGKSYWNATAISVESITRIDEV